jgi:enoyl-[acyl-carrier protein] reductase III
MGSYDFHGKTALVTGGSRGIGRAIALELAAHGADVAITFLRKRSAARETVRQIQAMGRRAAAYRGDMGEVDQLRGTFSQIRDEWDSIDFYINNAASGLLSPLLEIGSRHWEFIVDTNLTSTVIACREAVAMMPDKRGVIVLLSSQGSQRYVNGYGALGACKAAIESIGRTLAIELAPGINVNTICGGWIETDALRSLSLFEEAKKACENESPTGRMGQPEDLAKVVAFLCSDGAGWIRGQTLIVDGGHCII